MDESLPPQTNQPSTSQTPKEPAKGYGKKPAWFWILVYIVVGGLAYFLIYFFFLKDSSGGSLY